MSPLSPTSPLALEEPWRKLHATISGGPTSKFPYALSFSRIETLPIPQFIDAAYLKDEEKPLLLQLRTSLFDLESGMFFGRTWIDPVEFDLRAGSSKEEGGVEGGAFGLGAVDNGEGEKKGKRSKKTANLRRGTVVVSEGAKIVSAKGGRSGKKAHASSDEEDIDEDDGEEVEDQETDMKKKQKRGAKARNEEESSSSSSETSDGESGQDSESGSESGSESNEGEESDETDSSSGSEGAVLRGHRVSVNLHHEHLFLHTSLTSKHIIAVTEFVLIVEDMDAVDENDPDLFKPEFVSAGWTTPIFHGSPRILLFVAPLLMEYSVGFPSLAPIPGSSFTYEFSTRPDFRQLCYLWRENTFIGEGSDVPGLEFPVSSEIAAVEDSIAVVSKIRISVYPSLSKFEDALLTEAALQHYQSFPQSMTPDENGNLPLPDIIERRIHIGLHNTQTFLATPYITTLKPVYSDYVGGDGFEFVFNGNVELEKYVSGESGVAVVFVVEYKILLMTSDVSKKKTGLGGLIEKVLGEKKEAVRVGVEKIITVGWGAWTPTVFSGTNPQVIPLDTSVGPNPYSAVTFSPSIQADQMELNPEWLEYAFQMGRLATDEFPIVLSFYFYDEENPLSAAGRSSPIRDPIPQDAESEEDRAPTPKRPSSPPPLPKKQKKHDSDEDDDQMLNPSHTISTMDPSQFPKPSKYHGRKGGALSRAERARLQSAGFPLPLDDSGAKPHPLTLTPGEIASGLNVDLEVEGKDGFRNNEITFTLMGVSFTPELCMRLTGHFPTSVYFTYQFYNFPYCSTERMYIYTGPMPPGDNGHAQHQRSFSVPTNNPHHSRHWSQSSTSSFHSNVPSGNGGGPDAKKNGDGFTDCYWPGILYPIDEDGHVCYAPAGLSRTYLVENDIDACSTISTFSKTVPDVVQYLNGKSLHFDVWDGDSLLHLGAAVVELKPALRQGKGGVVYDDDVDIVFTEYINPSPLPRSASHASDISSVMSVTSGGHSEKTSRSTVIGKLHLRLVNIGRHTPEAGESAALMQQQQNHLVPSKSKRKNPYSKENVVVRDHRFRVGLRPEVLVMPLKLIEIDSELAQMLSTAYEERVRSRKKASKHDSKEDEEFLENVSDRRRKLDRVKRIMQRSHQYESALTEATMPFYYNLTRQERQRDLDTIDVFRERRKPPLIEKKLADQITVTHIINASFGQGHFFEYIFTNPYNEDHNFEIEWDDEELRLVTSTSEWKYLRRIHSIRVGVEDKLISVRPNGTCEIYMLANESVSIPFVFQSFLGGGISNASENESSVVGLRKLCGSESVPGGGIHPRKINVSFLNDKRMPVAMVDVVIKPRNYAVDRVLRFFRSEGELLRRTVKFYLSIPVGDGSGTVSKKEPGKKGHAGQSSLVTENSTIHDAGNPWKKYVRCSHPDVVISMSDAGKGHGNLKEIAFKYRVGPAPETSAIYFLLYDDPYHTSLHEVWRVFVHSLHRLDINCTMGQTNQSSLVLRGSSFSRTVQCYSNLPDELLVTANAPFILSANSLNEIGMLVRPRNETIRDIIMNVVDVDDQSLVSSWLVVSHCSIPTVTKSFEISVPRGKAVNKRVSYTNPYNTKRTFRLKTNAEHLVQFREGNMLQLDGGASQYISLRLLPNTMSSWSDILIFLNDDYDKIEECLRIKAVVGYLVSRAWTYLTAGFVETNPLLFVFCICALLLCGRYFERVWGTRYRGVLVVCLAGKTHSLPSTRELVKFVLLVNTLSVLMSTLTVFFEFVASQQNEDLLYKTYIGGMLGLLAAFLVAFKQAVPEHSLTVMGKLSLRVKNLPSIAFSVFLLLLILRIVHVDAFMVFYGTTIAWIYIRFFKHHDGLRGDRSESFSFGSFFPASTHRVIVPISNSTFNLLVSLHILPKLAPGLPQTSLDTSNNSNNGNIRPYSPKPLPGSDAADAERRRAIALKALDMRLKESSSLAVPTAGGGGVAMTPGGSSAGSRVASGAATPSRFGAVTGEAEAKE
ncbi:Nephrocystin-4 [Podochytrium sp. JEL0797]|nr:Nephrocystin-4 [Podochytrium sp. JEL0797]